MSDGAFRGDLFSPTPTKPVNTSRIVLQAKLSLSNNHYIRISSYSFFFFVQCLARCRVSLHKIGLIMLQCYSLRIKLMDEKISLLHFLTLYLAAN